jgi:signal recognition particle subunit SRP72
LSSRKNIAKYLIGMGEYARAASCLEGTRKTDSSDVEAVALLVLAYSEVDPKKAETYARYLSAQEIVAGSELDVKVLESGAELMSTAVRHAVVKKGKRHRKGKMPKNPDAKVDLERWIPKVERSYNQKRRGKRGEVKGPQGVNMAGGGIGSTGSARINGGEGVEAVAVVEKVEKPVAASKKGKKKRK